MTGSISGWAEGILFSLAFVTIFGFILANFNYLYGGDNSLGLTDNSTENLFIQYGANAQNLTQGSDIEFDSSNGITLKSSYGMTRDAINIVWSFLSGGFIEKIISYWNVGESGVALAKALRIIYFLSLVFALLYALFKVVI
jgi:hypothetical protein